MIRKDFTSYGYWMDEPLIYVNTHFDDTHIDLDVGFSLLHKIL